MESEILHHEGPMTRSRSRRVYASDEEVRSTSDPPSSTETSAAAGAEECEDVDDNNQVENLEVADSADQQTEDNKELGTKTAILLLLLIFSR